MRVQHDPCGRLNGMIRRQEKQRGTPLGDRAPVSPSDGVPPGISIGALFQLTLDEARRHRPQGHTGHRSTLGAWNKGPLMNRVSP